MTDDQQPIKIDSFSLSDLNKKVDELLKDFDKSLPNPLDYSAEDVQSISKEISEASKEYNNYSWGTVDTALEFLVKEQGFDIDDTPERISGVMNWIEACNNIKADSKLDIDWKEEYRGKHNDKAQFSQNALRNDIEWNYISKADTGFFDILGDTTLAFVPEKIGKFSTNAAKKVFSVAGIIHDIQETYSNYETKINFEKGGTLWSTKSLSGIYDKEPYQYSIEEVHDAITLKSLADYTNSYMDFYGATLSYFIKGEKIPRNDMITEYNKIVDEAKLAVSSRKMAISLSPELSDQVKNEQIQKLDYYYELIDSVGSNEKTNLTVALEDDNLLTESDRRSTIDSFITISGLLKMSLFGDLFANTGNTLQRPNINLLDLKNSFDVINEANKEKIKSLSTYGTEQDNVYKIQDQEELNAQVLSRYATVLFHDRYHDLEKRAESAIDALYKYMGEIPCTVDEVNRYAMYDGFLYNYFTDDEIFEFIEYNDNILWPYTSHVPDKLLDRIKESYITSKLPVPDWITEIEKVKDLSIILTIARAPMGATQSCIESGYKPALRVFGIQPEENPEGYANGGRATDASIFGEAGPEWAIPEQHSQRTAELLNSAREASGFSWTELIASTGGLNGGGNVVSNNITYAPVVHANDTRGIEEALGRDKQILDDWWKQKQWELIRTQWA